MKTDQIIAWAVLVVVIVIGAWYFTTDWGTPVQTPAPTATTTAATTSPEATTTAKPVAPRQKPAAPASPKAPTLNAQVVLTGYNSLAYLRTQKQPLFCSFDGVANGERRTGNIFVADGVARVNVARVAGGQAIATIMLDDGSYLYAWRASTTSTGIKLLASKTVNGSAMASYGGLDPAAEFSFSCTTWTVDSSLLTPPAGMTFSQS